MKLSVTKKIPVEQLPSEVRGWFAQVAQPLNNALDQFVRALSSQLTIADNLKGQKFNLEISANQTYPLKLAYNLNERPSAYLVELLPADGSVATLTGRRIELINGQLQVTFTGLAAVKHSLILVALV